MRKELLYNPRLVVERLALESEKRRRLSRLKPTVARQLQYDHIGSLELLELIREESRDKPLKVIYDVGANIGTWTLLGKAIFPQAQVHAFEPLERFHSGFHKNAALTTGVQLHKIALGSENSEQMMHVASDSSSFLPIGELQQSYFNTVAEKEEKIKVFRLDEYVQNQGLPLPDLIKLDIQGYELEALKGGLRCLSHARYVLVEVSFMEFYKGQPLFGEICAFMYGQGFHLLAQGVDTKLGERLYQTDVIFERR